jgi:hypothetical protein
MPESNEYNGSHFFSLRRVLPFLFLIVLGGCTSFGFLSQLSGFSEQSPGLSEEVLAALLVDTLSYAPLATGFIRISDLFVATSGAIYVADAGRHHVIRVAPIGARVDSIGGRGMGSVQFDGPTHVDAGNELKIFISDIGNRRISMFDRRWQHLGHLDLRPERYEPGAMVQTPAGELIFWDIESQRLRKIRADLQTDSFFNPDVSEITHAIHTIMYHNGILYLIEGNTGLLHRFSVEGRKLGVISAGAVVLDSAILDAELLLLTSFGLIRMQPSGELTQLHRFAERAKILRVAADGNVVYIATSNALFVTYLSD